MYTGTVVYLTQHFLTYDSYEALINNGTVGTGLPTMWNV